METLKEMLCAEMASLDIDVKETGCNIKRVVQAALKDLCKEIYDYDMVAQDLIITKM